MVGGACLIGASSPPVAEQACSEPTAAEIAARHDQLLRAISAGRLDEVMAHYGADTIFMGLDAPSIRLGRHEVRAYYRQHLRSPPRYDVLERNLRASCQRATESGVLALTPNGSTASPQHIRFIVHYALADGRWQIIHHHAERLHAAVPEAGAARTSPGAARSTGSLPQRSFADPQLARIEVPPPAFRLPSAPPVIVVPGPRFILTPQGAVPRPIPDVVQRPRDHAAPSAAVPPPVAPTLAGDVATAAAAVVVEPPAVAPPQDALRDPGGPLLAATEVHVPPLPFTLPLEPPVLARATDASKAPTAVSTPAPSDAAKTAPSRVPAAGQAVATVSPLPAAAKPAPVSAIPAPTVAAAPVGTAPVGPATPGSLPAVAGFTQRATEATTTPPPANSARTGRRAGGPTASKAPAPATSSGYRAGRWADGMPVYD